MRTRSASRGRRIFLRSSGAVPSALLLLALGNASYRQAGAVSATPACMDDDQPTPQQTAGPFFQPHSPQRASLLEPGINGTKIVLAGRVLSTECGAVSGALLDFWHANDAGEYDVEGFRLRGHPFADSEGPVVGARSRVERSHYGADSLTSVTWTGSPTRTPSCVAAQPRLIAISTSPIEFSYQKA
jgi:hypothetical protein